MYFLHSEKTWIETCQTLRGEFSFIATETLTNNVQRIVASRDPLGVKPLFYSLRLSSESSNDDGIQLALASEVKGLPESMREEAVEIQPGCLTFFYITENGNILSPNVMRYFSPKWFDPLLQPNSLGLFKEISPESDLSLSLWRNSPQALSLRKSLTRSIERRLMTQHDRIGVLLSGGVDSSLVAVIASELLKEQGKHPSQLHTFTISYRDEADEMFDEGRNSQLDRHHAKMVADLIKSTHHDCFFNKEEAASALEKVVWHLETDDMISIRASIPLFLLFKYVSSVGIKCVLVGEGADEVFGGYSLFTKFLPGEVGEFQHELLRRLSLISGSELLRVDRCSMAWGVEARVPFLDQDFLDVAMSHIPPSLKMPHVAIGWMEKAVLRKSFEGFTNLPNYILFRKKVEFASGMGEGWWKCLSSSGLTLILRKLFGSRLNIVRHRNEVRRSRRLLPNDFDERPSCQWHSLSSDPLFHNQLSSFDTERFVRETLGLEIQDTQKKETRERGNCLLPPNFKTLQFLIERFLVTIPFQNLTILCRKREPPSASLIISDMLMGLGGGCATLNTFFGILLTNLGFEVSLLPATIHQPDCHVTLLVLVEGRYWFIDVGNGKPYFSPFLVGGLEGFGEESKVKNEKGEEKKAKISSENQNHLSYARLRYDEEKNIHLLEHRDRNDPFLWNKAYSVCLSKSVHFSSFLPSIKLSRTQPSYGPFLRGIRVCRLKSPIDTSRKIAVRDRIVFDDKNPPRELLSYEELEKFLLSRFEDLPHFCEFVKSNTSQAMLSALFSTFGEDNE